MTISSVVEPTALVGGVGGGEGRRLFSVRVDGVIVPTTVTLVYKIITVKQTWQSYKTMIMKILCLLLLLHLLLCLAAFIPMLYSCHICLPGSGWRLIEDTIMSLISKISATFPLKKISPTARDCSAPTLAMSEDTVKMESDCLLLRNSLLEA